MERRKYTREFKLEAVKLITDRGVKAGFMWRRSPAFTARRISMGDSTVPKSLPCQRTKATGASSPTEQRTQGERATPGGKFAELRKILFC
jgi:transposase-like protein